MEKLDDLNSERERPGDFAVNSFLRELADNGQRHVKEVAPNPVQLQRDSNGRWGQALPPLHLDRAAGKVKDNQPVKPNDTPVAAPEGQAAAGKAEKANVSDRLPSPKYDSKQKLTEVWAYGKYGQVHHFVKVGEKQGKPIWVVDRDNRTREQVEKAYRVSKAQVERGVPGVAAREKGMLSTVGVEMDVEVSADGKHVTVKSSLDGRPVIGKLATTKDAPANAPGITLDAAGKPELIVCKNSNGRTETFKRVGTTKDGQELWSINGEPPRAMAVKADANGLVTLTYTSGDMTVTHEIRNGVRKTQATRRS